MTNDTVQTHQHEIAVENVVFKPIEYVEQQQPGLPNFIEASIDHLGDNAHDATKDDDGVRNIARRMIAGAKHEANG